MFKRFVRWAVLILVLAGVVVAIGYTFVPRPQLVDVAAVTRGPMMVTVDEEGKTRVRERFTISSPLSGRLRRVWLDPGDGVAQDESIVAVIDPTPPAMLDARSKSEAEARVRANEADLRRAEAASERASIDAEHAHDELDRIRRAFEASAATRNELEQAVTNARVDEEVLRAAEFSRQVAQFELDLAKSALLYSDGEQDGPSGTGLEIRSPITGRVLRVFEESAAVVAPGDALLELGDPTDLEIVVDVLSRHAVRISLGDRVIIEHWGGARPLEARVRLVEPSAFTKISALGVEEQRVNVIADFVDPPADRMTLGDQYRVEARIVVWEQPQVVQAPTSAVFRDGPTWAVFVVSDELAERRVVELGQRNDRAVQVSSGLVPGDLVILHPGDKIADGVKVMPRGDSALEARVEEPITP